MEERSTKKKKARLKKDIHCKWYLRDIRKNRRQGGMKNPARQGGTSQQGTK